MHSLTQQKLSIVQNQHTVLVLAQGGKGLLSVLDTQCWCWLKTARAAEHTRICWETAAVASPLNAKDAWLRSPVKAFPRRLGCCSSVGGTLTRVCKALV